MELRSNLDDDFSPEPLQRQQQESYDYASRAQAAAQREQGIQRIFSEVSTVQRMFSDMASVVQQQGEQVQGIASNVVDGLEGTNDALGHVNQRLQRGGGGRNSAMTLLMGALGFLFFVWLFCLPAGNVEPPPMPPTSSSKPKPASSDSPSSHLEKAAHDIAPQGLSSFSEMQKHSDEFYDPQDLSMHTLVKPRSMGFRDHYGGSPGDPKIR